MSLGPELQAAYARLAEQVDSMFRRNLERYRSQIHCGAGCADCCQQDLRLLEMELARLLEAAAGLPLEERRAVLQAARALRAGEREACALLDERERCRVHPARPLICRSHGLALLMRPVDGAEGEAELSVCPQNFSEDAQVDGDCVLDLTSMQAALAALDHMAGGDGKREAISAALLARLTES